MAPPELLIRGWPAPLGEEEIKGLLETVGSLRSLTVLEEEGGKVCRCRYTDDEATSKAIKGFHELEMGDVRLKVEELPSESANGGKEDRDRDRDRRSRSREQTQEEPPRKKKSRFAPPPPGADAVAAAIPGLGLDPAAAAAAAVRSLQMSGGLAGAGGAAAMPGMGGLLGGVPGVPGLLGHYGVGAMAGAAGAQANATPQLKAQLELFVGNIPTGTTQQGLQDFINAAMTQVGLAQPGQPGPGPVTAARLSNKFAFLVFRSVEECTAAVLNISGIPYLGHMLKVQRPSSYKGPAEYGKSWQQLTGQEPLPPEGMGQSTMGSSMNPMDKIMRELFIGNVPADTQPAILKEYIGTAMIQVGLVPADKGNPIVNIRMNPGSRFSFVEMNSVENAAKGLNLDGIPFGGINLSVARPSKYTGPPTPHKTWFDMLAETTFAGGGGSQPPSTVIRLGNVVTEEELTSDETYKEVVEDMREECSKYGRVVDLEVPRQGALGGGFGYVFVQYATVDEAAAGKATFGARTFDKKPVEAIFFSEEKFKERSFAT